MNFINEQPLVSIIIPMYNSEEYISETLESCLVQDYPNIEIIIVDDGSKDKSIEIVKDYVLKNENVHFYVQSNSGAPVARNLGFSKSSGQYIQFLDADDLLSPNKISLQISKLKNKPSTAISSSSLFRFTSDRLKKTKIIMETDRSFPSGIDWLSMAWQSSAMGQTATWLCHRELIELAGLWDERLVKNQDGEFFCRVLTQCSEVIYVSEAEVLYRATGATSISYSRKTEALDSILLSYELYEKHVFANMNEQLKFGLAQCYYDFIEAYYPYKTEFVLEKVKMLDVGKHKIQSRGLIRLLSMFVGYLNAIKIRHFVKRYIINRVV